MIGNVGGMFVGTLMDGEKRFLKGFLVNARKTGYTNFVEPCSGAFAMSFLAAECGFAPENIEAGDVTFFSGVVGRAVEGRSLDDMEISIEGFSAEELKDPATALYAQLYWRKMKAVGVEYFRELAKDIAIRRNEHIESINRQLDLLKKQCGGLRYRDVDLMRQVEEHLDEENTVIVICLPTYTQGYEKFFDTADKISWKEPNYDIFDVNEGLTALCEKVKDAKALVIIYEERRVGDAVGDPVYARDAGRQGIRTYLVANRPEEAAMLAEGKQIETKSGVKMTPLNYPTLPLCYEITRKSSISVLPIKAENATYYRRLWTHNFVGGASSSSMAMIVDGYVAGVFGYDKFTMSLGNASDLLFKFGMTAPNSKHRLNRLMYMLAVNRDQVNHFLDDMEKETIHGVMTVMITKYPESKEMRGIMKLVKKEKDDKCGFKLQYRTPICDRTAKETVIQWLQKEDQWKRKKGSSPNEEQSLLQT